MPKYKSLSFKVYICMLIGTYIASFVLGIILLVFLAYPLMLWMVEVIQLLLELLRPLEDW